MATNKQGNKQGEGSKQGGGEGGQGKGTSNRGFASMDPERQREIASEGGKAAHEKGTAHEFTSEEARRAGSMSHGNRQSEHASSESKSHGTEKEQAGKDSNAGKHSKREDSEQGGNKQSGGGGSKTGKDQED